MIGLFQNGIHYLLSPCPDPPVLRPSFPFPSQEGWLWKRGEVNKGFQRRYFVLKGNLLFYFERQGDREPAGVVVLEGCTVELAEEEQEKFAFKVAFHGEGKRTYVLGTDTQVRRVNRVLESGLEIIKFEKSNVKNVQHSIFPFNIFLETGLRMQCQL